MNQIQKERRRAATRAFLESLEQLENRLMTEEDTEAVAPDRRDRSTPSTRSLVDDFAEAVADIEKHDAFQYSN